MRILCIVQGRYGQRIAANLCRASIPGWNVESWALPPVLPPVIDYPEEFLPATLPAADLLLSLGEHPGVAELLPDIVRLCGARAVIAPVDNVAWLPPGLRNQLAGWLAELGVPGIYRSQASLAPGVKVRMGTRAAPHAGIGVKCYAWSTSPLRRYTDLVNQWQLVALSLIHI